MIIADTSALFAYFNIDDPDHRVVRDTADALTEPIVVSPYVVAELDYLVASRGGPHEELTVLHELTGGGYDLAAMSSEDVRTAISVIERYIDQAIGLADASLVVLADRYRTRTLLTLDHRHFSVVRPLAGGRFKLLP